MRDGQTVDLAALRAGLIARHDQVEAMSHTVSGLDSLVAMTVPLLRLVGRLDEGDLAGAVDMVSLLLQ